MAERRTLVSLLAGGCYSFGARDSVPMVVITYTNGGVIPLDDRTEVYGDGRYFAAASGVPGSFSKLRYFVSLGSATPRGPERTFVW